MDEDIVWERNAVTDHRPGSSNFPRTGIRPATTSQPVRVYATAPSVSPYYYAVPPQAPAASTLFGRMTTGQVIDLVAQIFAALMPLPAAPVATSDASTDVGNMLLYQQALAKYAKQDEQVRTLGNLVTKLVG